MMMFSKASGVFTSAVARTMMSWLPVVSEPAGVSKATVASALRDVGDGQAEARELGLVDVDAEDLLAVAIDLHVGDAGDRRERVEDLVLDEDRHVLDRHGVGGDGKAHDRVGVGVGLDDARRIGVFGQAG